MGLFDALYLGSELALMSDLPFYSTVTGMYVSVSEIVNRVGLATAAQLSADSGETPDETLILSVIQEAEAEVNGYLAARYRVPVDLTAHPELNAALRGRATDIALWRLFARRPPVPDEYEKLYKSAKEWLTMVAKGEIPLPATATPAATTSKEPQGGYGTTSEAMDW